MTFPFCRKYGIQALAQQHQSYSSFEHAPIWQQVAASEKSMTSSYFKPDKQFCIWNNCNNRLTFSTYLIELLKDSAY